MLRLTLTLATATLSMTLLWSPHAAASWTVKWTCGNSTQCATVMGGASGTSGPFASEGECQAWRRKYNSNSSCSENAGGAPESTDVGANAGRIASDLFRAANPYTNAQTINAMGLSIAGGVGIALLQEALRPASAAEIRQRQIQEEFARQERERIARERAAAELARHNALLDSLHLGKDRTDLSLKLNNDPALADAPKLASNTELTLKLGGDAALPLTPFSNGVPASAAIDSEPELALKLGDTPAAPAGSALQQLLNTSATNNPVDPNNPNNKQSPGYQDAMGGFDTAATKTGRLDLSAAAPPGKAVEAALEQLKELKPGEMTRERVEQVFGKALDTNRASGEALKEQITKLEQAPKKDDQQIKDAYDKLLNLREEKEQLEKKKKEYVDLSLDSLAADATGGSGAGAAGAPNTSGTTGSAGSAAAGAAVQ